MADDIVQSDCQRGGNVERISALAVTSGPDFIENIASEEEEQNQTPSDMRVRERCVF